MFQSRVALFRSRFIKTVSTGISLALMLAVSQATDSHAAAPTYNGIAYMYVTGATPQLSVSSGVYEYSTSVTNSRTTTDLGVFLTAGETATVSWSGNSTSGSSDIPTNGADSTKVVSAIPLSYGVNTVIITPTSQSGARGRTYTVTITRTLATDSVIAAIIFPGMALGYNKDVTSYSVSVPNSVSTATVKATWYGIGQTSTFNINGGGYTPLVNDSASSSFNLVVGTNTINVVGIAQDGTTTTYVISITRAAARISVAAIGGVTAPVTGATPVSTVTAANGYTGTVSWSGSPTTFAPDTAYTAIITLTAASGYTLSGVSANFFTVTGATSVTHSANSGVITAAFGSTGHRVTLSYVLNAPNATVDTSGKTIWNVGATNSLTPPTPTLTNGSGRAVTFRGWKDSVTGSVTSPGTNWSPSDTESSSSRTVTMTAQWGFDVSYSYRFYDAATSTDTTINATSGGVWPTAPNPQRAGYTLIGWKTQSGTPVVRGGFPFRWLVNQNGTDYLVADWKPNIYQMVFNQPNGGTYTSNNGVQVVTTGTNAISPPTMSKVGYTFAGWFDDSNVRITSSYVPGDNKCNMYYFSPCPVFPHAVWTAKTTTITFAGNTGTGTAPSNLTYTSGTSLALPSNTFTPPAGQTFVGWSLSTNGALISSYNTPTDSASVTIYAIWSGSAQYVVSFDSNLGSSVSPITVSSGSALTLPTPTRTGYGFAGWYTNFGLGSRIGTASSYTSYTPTSSTTIYARWLPGVYTLIFRNTGAANGGASATGNAPSYQYYVFGGNLTLPGSGTLSLADKTFRGWSLSPYQSSTSSKITNFGQSTIIDNFINGSNINLYPIWT